MQATLSHYRVLEQIGEGGQCAVYRAHDEGTLDRDVALKVLPRDALADEAARKRFRREATALSRLNHPNIATVFDFGSENGTDFLVEELIPGLSLNEMLISGPLAEREIVNLGSQLCEGLAAAHEQGIVHRDLKPGNIRVTPDARLKILDFGLAKVARAPVSSSDTDATASLTETQTVSGTFPYMAPEQLLNEKLDARIDIWAAGCVLYEMASGRRPFLGYGPALIDAILHQPPTELSKVSHKMNPGLEAIILKCLEKDPALRYASARDLAVDLHRLGMGTAPKAQTARRRTATLRVSVVIFGLLIACAGALALYRWLRPSSAQIRSIAVLPLANLSGDPQQEYLADGITDALIGELCKISSLKVISRTSSMQYKGVKRPLPEIGRELGVEAVIEGSVVRDGRRVRVMVQFIDAASDRNLWGDSYDRDLTNILALQSDVASAIAARTKTEITPRERVELARSRPVKPEAYEAYLRGRYLIDSVWSRADVEKAVEYFQRATELDPTYALAYAWLAEAIVMRDEPLSSREKAAALKALQLDDSLAEAHLAVARTADLHDWTTAEREYKRALELKPNYTPALSQYAGYYLSYVGRHDQAIAMLKRAVELDPRSLLARTRLGRRFFFARRYDEAIEQFKYVLEMKPDDLYARGNLGMVYVYKGMIQRGLTELERAGDPERLALGYAVAGRKREALALLHQHEPEWAKRSPGALAATYANCGQKDEAFRWLEEAYKIQDSFMWALKVHPAFDPLRPDPRFQDMLRRVNFPD